MIDLTQWRSELSDTQLVTRDPGTRWVKNDRPAIEAPPDNDTQPLPESTWPQSASRTGICGAVSPRVVRLRDGSYRLYYTQILPRESWPAGANDYDHATTRILSAVSRDGASWTPEPGVRLSAIEGGAGSGRVASSEVVPTIDGGFRMYFECCPGTQSEPSTIRSAVSRDGLSWSLEPGVRWGKSGKNFMAARIVFLGGARVRLYCCENGRGIVSARSDDGLTFVEDPGTRIAQDGPYDSTAAFAPDIVSLSGGGWVMFYAGYHPSDRAHILRATSNDGIQWTKESSPAVTPGGRWDRVKSSEVCLFRLPNDGFGMVYEGCDGTAAGKRGVWRIAGARSERA